MEEALRQSIQRHVRYTLAKPLVGLTPRELLKPVSLAIRDYLVDGILETEQRYAEHGSKRLFYLSLEFLMGRWLSDNLCNLRLNEPVRQILRQDYSIALEDVLESEMDMGLGNGGLGRLAAC